MIEIWQPRYIDNTCLIATFKVVDGENLITFTKDKKLKDKVFSVDSSVIRSCPINSNGKIECYAVPMKALHKTETEV